MTVSEFFSDLEYDARKWLGLDSTEYINEDPFEDDYGKEWLEEMTGETSIRDLKKIIFNYDFLHFTDSTITCSVNYHGNNLILWCDTSYKPLNSLKELLLQSDKNTECATKSELERFLNEEFTPLSWVENSASKGQ